MARRTRIYAYGTCVLLIVAGITAAAVVPGLAGQLTALVLNSLGFCGIVLLVFLEVGLSEDREREAEEARRTAAVEKQRPLPRRRITRIPRRPR